MDIPNGQCVKESSPRLLPVFGNLNLNPNGAKYCMKVCKDKGHSFAGTQSGSQCFCGDTAPPKSSFIPASKCNAQCTGNKKEMCGQAGRMNVYQIGKYF